MAAFSSQQSLNYMLCPVTGCTIIGIEIDETAVPLHTQPFSGNTAFMLGNEVRAQPREPRVRASVSCEVWVVAFTRLHSTCPN
jgi:hypothetical protein